MTQCTSVLVHLAMLISCNSNKRNIIAASYFLNDVWTLSENPSKLLPIYEMSMRGYY